MGEAYELLDGPAQRVMQALSVFPAPVSAVGVDFLLRPVDPTTDAAPILTRLVRRQMVRFQNARYDLHPLDREYARARIPAGGPDDSLTAFTLIGLQARAADYYAQIRTPRDSWRSLEDVRPQLAEFELRCATGDYDTAATVLHDIDFKYLQAWGYLGEYRRAIDLHAQALAIARDIGNRYSEANALDNLGQAWLASGDVRQGVMLLGQALSIADVTGDIQAAIDVRSWLARAHLQLGDAAAALALTAVERELTYPPEEPAMRLLEGLALLELNHPGESSQAFNEALAAADALLALADRNVGALEARALALSGLAVVADDPARAPEATEAFARARAVTTAVGVVADTSRLLAIITAHDQDGLLTAIGSESGS